MSPLRKEPSVAGPARGWRWLLFAAVLECPIPSAASMGLLYFILSLVIAPLLYLNLKAPAAETISGFQDAGWLEWALKLDPAQPVLHYRLGLLKQFSLDSSDSVSALRHLRAAGELSPWSGPYWLAVAAASEDAGDAPGAQSAIRRALECRPMSPDYWWRAGNISIRTGEYGSAWTYFRHALELSPSYSELIFQLSYRVAGDYRVIGEKILPINASPTLQMAYVDFISRQGEFDGAFQAWEQLSKKAGPGQLVYASVQPYVNRLLDNNRLAEADSVWQQLLNWRVVSRPASMRPEDAAFNGGFEQAPLESGFDWRVRPAPMVAVDLQATPAYQGSKSARIDFTVANNMEAEMLYQVVPVEPCRSYRLEAFVRSEGITSESGPRLRIMDAEAPGRLIASTPMVVGTTDWHAVSAIFSTGPETRFVRLAVWREKSRVFPTEIAGRFWLDSLTFVATGPANTAPRACEP